MDERCERCGRPAPPQESTKYLEWETLDGDHLICPGCVTAAEQQSMDEDIMRLADTTPLGEPSDPRDDDGGRT